MPHTPHQTTHNAIGQGSSVVSSTVLGIDAFGFTAAELAAADTALVIGFTQTSMMTWCYGDTPSATNGIPIKSLVWRTIRGNLNIRNMRFLRAGGTDGRVQIVLSSSAGTYTTSTTAPP